VPVGQLSPSSLKNLLFIRRRHPPELLGLRR
jgi:hypothetical protein